MNIPDGLFYTDQHEWIKVEGGTGTVGISDFAQNALGDITFVELPKVGKQLAKGDEAVALESCKAAASVYSPAGGEVTAANDALSGDPAAINTDPYGAGWIYKLKLTSPADVSNLMDAAAYRTYCQNQGAE